MTLVSKLLKITGGEYGGPSRGEYGGPNSIYRGELSWPSTQLPSIWPVFRDFAIDNKGRIWINVITDDRQHSVYWVVTEAGSVVAKISLDGDVDLQKIQDGYAYGIVKEENGLQEVIKYKIVESN